MAQQEKQHLFFGLLHLYYQRGKIQQTYVQNRTRLAKVASYETSQETSVSCTQLVVLYAPFHFGSEYNFLGNCVLVGQVIKVEIGLSQVLTHSSFSDK